MMAPFRYYYFFIIFEAIIFAYGYPSGELENLAKISVDDGFHHKSNIPEAEADGQKNVRGNGRKPRQDDGDGDGDGGDGLAVIRPFFEGAAEGFLGAATNLVQNIQSLGQPITEPPKPKTTAKTVATTPTTSIPLPVSVATHFNNAILIAPAPAVTTISTVLSNTNNIPVAVAATQVPVAAVPVTPTQIPPVLSTTIDTDEDDDDDDEDTYAA